MLMVFGCLLQETAFGTNQGIVKLVNLNKIEDFVIFH